MGAWSAWQIPEVPSGLTNIVDTASSISSTVTTVLKTVKDALSALSQANLSPPASTAQGLIDTAIGTLEDGLKELTEGPASGAGLYLLAVPVRKQTVIPSVLRTALDATGMLDLPAGPQDIEQLIAQEAIADQGPEALASFSKAMTAEGGNAGFLRTVAESLSDTGDANRPQLAETDAVAGFCILAGASDYSKMSSFLTAFKALVGAQRPAVAMDAPALPVPQNVKARVVSGSAPAVALSWDYQQPYEVIPTLGISIEMYQVAVIRSQSSKLVSQFTATEIFGTNKLTAGMKVGVGTDVIEVVAIFESSQAAIISEYQDTSITEDGTYYYAVAYNVKAGNTADMLSGSGAEQGFDKLSNVVKLEVLLDAPETGAIKSAGGVPPDWVRMPTVISLFPDLSSAIDKLSSMLGSLTNYTAKPSDTFTKYIEFLGQEIQQWEEQVKSISEPVTKLTTMLSTMSSLGGMYIHTIEGSGGTAFLLKDLNTALLDKTDSSRPPFDTGTEFVSGLVVIATAPSAADLAALQSSLASVLTGTGLPESPVAQALKEIDRVLTAAEAKTFGDNFAVGGTPSGVTPVNVLTTGKPQIGSEDLGLNNCPTPATASHTFADNFQVISGG